MNNFNSNNLQNLSSMFEHYEAPFGADEMNADWQQVANKIGAGAGAQAATGSGASSNGLLGSLGAKLGLGVIGVSAIIGALSLFGNNEKNQSQFVNEEQVVEVLAIERSNKIEEETNTTQETKIATVENNEPATKPVNRNSTQVSKQKGAITNTNPKATSTTQTASTIINDNKNLESENTSKPKPELQISSENICQNGLLNLKIKNPKENAIYWFNMINESNGRVETGTIRNSKKVQLPIVGNYKLSVFEMLNEDNKTIAQQTVIVHQKPKAKMQAESLACGQVEFKSTSANASSCFWIIDNMSYTGKSIEHSFSTEGYKKVMLIAANNHCADTLIEDYFGKPTIGAIENLQIPNIFTPNADGNNDTWDILSKNPQLADIEGQIDVYNSRDELVFRSINGLSDNWNGKLMNVGPDCEQGMYKYVLSYHNPCGNEETTIIKGLISIKR